MKLSHWHCVMFNPRLMYEMSLLYLNIENNSEIIAVTPMTIQICNFLLTLL